MDRLGISDIDVWKTVTSNVCDLICSLLNERSAVRMSLIYYAFRGLKPPVIARLLGDKFSQRYILECTTTHDQSSSPLFTAKIQHSPHKTMTEDEKTATIEVMHGEFEQKSGQRHNTLFTRVSQFDLYTRYLELYPEIRRAVISRGREMRVKARSLKTVFYRIFEDFNIYRLKKPHSCPHCQEDKTHTLRDVTLPEIRAKLVVADRAEQKKFLERQLTKIVKRLDMIPEHKKKMEFQRKTYTDLRNSLQPDQCILVMDFVSWYFPKDPTDAVAGSKNNDLVITIEFREDGNLKRHYLDFPCHQKGSSEHDHYFFAQVLYFLYTKTSQLIVNGQPRWKRIYRVSDNGSPFKSYAALFVESYLAMKFSVDYHVIALCPYHAYSICDAHGSQIKRKLAYAEIAGNYPYEQNDLKNVLESLKSTYCYPQTSIDKGFVNETLYDLIGGPGNVKDFGNVRRLGYIKYIRGVLHDKNTWGHMLTQLIANQPDVWPWNLPKGCEQPTYTFRTLNSWSDLEICQRCSSLQGKLVNGDHDCTVQEIKAKRKPLQRDSLTISDIGTSINDEEDDSDYVPTDDELSVSSGDDEEDGESVAWLRCIVDHRCEKGVILYQCRWFNYPPDQDTFQDESSLPASAIESYKATVYSCSFRTLIILGKIQKSRAANPCFYET